MMVITKKYYQVVNSLIVILATLIIISNNVINGITLPFRNNNFLRSKNTNTKSNAADINDEKAAWCHADFMEELELQKTSFTQFFGKKVLSDSSTESFNFQHEISQYSCQLSRMMEKLMGQREGNVTVATGGGSATAGGGWIGESKAWPHYLEPYLNKLNDIVKKKDKKYKNNKIKFYNAAHGSTNSVYNGMLQSSLYPSPTPSKHYLSSFLMSSGSDETVMPFDMILGEFRINDYKDSDVTTKYPEFMYEFWLRRSLKFNNVGNIFPIIGLVDIWDDHNGKSTVEDVWRKTTGKKFEAMFPIGDIFSVSLSHYIKSSGKNKEHYRALYPKNVVNGHTIHDWDNHINIPGHEILAQLLSQKISDLMLRICLNRRNDQCNDDQAIYTSYTNMLNKLQIPSIKDIKKEDTKKKITLVSPLLGKYNIFENLVTSNQLVSTILKSWKPQYGSTNDIIICHAAKNEKQNIWECSDGKGSENGNKEHLLDGTKTVHGRVDKFVGVDSPLCNSKERIMIQYKLNTFNIFALFTPIGSDSYTLQKDSTKFQWYEYKQDNMIDISKDNDVSNDIESIDTTNSILALKEYRHFFQYLFVNKKLSSVNDIHSNEKKKRISSMMKKKDGKALTLLICSDLKEMPTKKNDIFTLSGALAL